MRKTFVVYSDWIEYIDCMSDEEVAEFFKSILDYNNWKEVVPKTWFKYIRNKIKKTLDDDNMKREKRQENLKNAGKKWGKSKASKWKQMLANASKWKHFDSVTDTVTVTVTDTITDTGNKNNVITSLSKDKDSNAEITTDINFIISELKKTADTIGIAYNNKQEREFSKHILSAKEFWNFCEKIWQNRVEFSKNVMIASAKINYWKWPRAWPIDIYRDYADVYNISKKKSQESDDRKIWVLPWI